VSDLDIRRQPGGDQRRPAEERRRTAWPWLLVVLLLMAVSLAGGIAIGGNRDAAGPSRSPGFESGTASSVAAVPTATPECAEAVRRANASLSHAVAVSAALRRHTEIMNKLLHDKIDAATALRTGTPSLIAGSAESAKFDVALADYRKVVDRCQLRTP
jgi:hypothetical protein